MPSTTTKSLLLFLGIPALALLTCCGGCAVFVWARMSHPSNRELAEKFREHRGDFERLVAMANEDAHLIRIAPDGALLADGGSLPSGSEPSGERWSEYRRLMRETGIKVAINRDPDPPHKVEFTAYYAALSALSGSMGGYVYSPGKAPSPLARSLEEPPPPTGNAFYWPLAGDWYLFLYQH